MDEILALGDEAFQAKSKARMMDLMSGGTTVMFVSHSLDQIPEMCDRVLWLDHGRMKMLGIPDACATRTREAGRKSKKLKILYTHFEFMTQEHFALIPLMLIACL